MVPMEIEAKYAILDEQTGTQLRATRRLAGFKVTPGRHLSLHDTYLDTATGDIRAAGLACRRRVANGRGLLTLKGLGSAQASVHTREETEIEAPEPFDPSPTTWPEGALRERVLSLIGDRPLIPQFTIDQDRLARKVREPKGSTVAELAIDTGHISYGGDSILFTELEIELAPGATPDVLAEILDALSGLPGLAAQPTSKFERGLAFAARVGKQALAEEQVCADDPFGVAVCKVLRPHFFRMQAHEAGTYAGTDPEELHDMRVAIRRMRTVIWIARPYLDMDALGPVTRGLRRAADILGAVRDMDVFRQKTEAYIADKSAKAADFVSLFAVWDAEYARRRNELLRYLGSRRYGRLKEALWTHLAPAAPANSPQGLPALDPSVRVDQVVPGIARQRLAALLEHGTGIGTGKLSLAGYHALRIDGKRLRYTLEVFRGVLGPEVGDAIEALKKLQDASGDLQDAVVAVAHLEAVGSFGTWEPPRQPGSLWQSGPACGRGPDTPLPTGLRRYLRARKSEIKAFVAKAPATWQRFLDDHVPEQITTAAAALEAATLRGESIMLTLQDHKENAMAHNPTYVILMGPPASGKGTQAERLQELLALPHVASGDLFRYNLKNETPLGLRAKAYMDKGELVPDDITIAMVLDRLARPDCAKGALLDGFPRTLPQAAALDTALAEKGSGIDLVLNIKVPDDVLIERVTGRRLCRQCGASYHIKFALPQTEGVCDKCGGELYQRDDDTEPVARKRLEVYDNQTSPLIEYYASKGVLVAIDGDQPIDEVTAALRGAIEARL